MKKQEDFHCPFCVQLDIYKGEPPHTCALCCSQLTACQPFTIYFHFVYLVLMSVRTADFHHYCPYMVNVDLTECILQHFCSNKAVAVYLILAFAVPRPNWPQQIAVCTRPGEKRRASDHTPNICPVLLSSQTWPHLLSRRR